MNNITIYLPRMSLVVIKSILADVTDQAGAIWEDLATYNEPSNQAGLIRELVDLGEKQVRCRVEIALKEQEAQ